MFSLLFMLKKIKTGGKQNSDKKDSKKFIYNLTQKIEDVVKSRELREHIGKMNKKVFEQMYSLKIMKEKYLYLFEDL